MSSDDDTATTSLLLSINTVFNVKTLLLDSFVKGLGVLVVTDTAKVCNAVGWEDVLGTTGSVLGCSAGNELGFEVGEEILIETKVLLLGKDGVVGL